jgi:hypothetical protein
MIWRCPPAWLLAAHKDHPIWHDRHDGDQRDVDEPGRRNEHNAGGPDLETSELADGTLSMTMFDMTIAALCAPANQAQGWPLDCEHLAMTLHDFGAPRAMLDQFARLGDTRALLFNYAEATVAQRPASATARRPGGA